MSYKDNDDGLVCSFCGKRQDVVRKLVAGPGVYICDECIDLCNEIIAEDVQSAEEEAKEGFAALFVSLFLVFFF